MAINLSKTTEAAFRFGLHVIIGALLFALISAAAIALNQFITFCDGRNLVPQFVLMGMRGLEYGMWTVDGVCFAWLFVAEGVRFVASVGWRD
ncbi:MAG: hypothetical protein WDM92_03650 [Caulobacteraceae bacterium]